ncbi:hypothetical protein [Microbacterium sp. Bi128]|uniref:hypothetical protein n=1 Tax=Microbacterium sp. Bi128 TaxID=2821115 RepID=UPI001E0E779F|nr:hypothetical protein [Microbacterium sp. Bi128]CAH0254087.1 hypothetical protein SRABI128_02983 [Microbacterium sp. Bi128]
MTVHIDTLTAELAMDEWTAAEIRIRTTAALAKADVLDALSKRLHESDRFDAALGIWREFIDGRRSADRIDPILQPELDDVVTVFLRVMRWLSEIEIVSAAREAFGDVALAHANDAGSLSWSPTDSMLCLRFRGLLLDSLVVLSDDRGSDRMLTAHPALASGAAA